MFEAHGAVQSCTLVQDKTTGLSKGFGFVEMPKPGEAKAATKNLNGKEVAGNKIRVKKAALKQKPDKEKI
jgi:RNA recognition motif-containing protein